MLAMIVSPPSGCAMHARHRGAQRQVRPIPLRFDHHRRRGIERPQFVADDARAAAARSRRAAALAARSPPATPAPIASIAISGTM